MTCNGVLNRLFSYRCKLVAILLAWSATIGSLAWWYDADHANNMYQMARIYSQACYDTDVVCRQWNSTHDGVCLTAFKSIQSSPYLQAAERDVFPPPLSPEPAANTGNVQAHITSLKPLNPSNVPDEWEWESLRAFETGEKEASVVVHRDGKHTARLMRPLYAKQSCLKCHEEQAYKIGDVRGGISVTVPVDSLWTVETQQARIVLVALGGIWTLGVVTIVLVGKFVNQRRMEREQATEALAKKQEFLNAVLDHIRDGIMACDAAGVPTVFNAATRTFHGIPETPIPAEQWPRHFDLYLPDGATLMRKEDVPLYRALQGEPVQNSEMVIAPKHGTPRRLLADGQQLLVDGKLVGAVVVMHDITERSQAEKVLRESEERYRTLVENIDVGITLIDREHRILMVNESHARMFQRTAGQCVGQKCFRVFENRETVCPHCPGVRAMQTGLPAEVETQGVRDDGSMFSVKLRAFPTRDSAGTSTGFIEIVEDITNHKRTDEERNRAKQAAEAANRAKSEFLANMSHEIRTPMTAIIGYADVLLDAAKDKDSIESAQIIKRNGMHLLDLINDILDLSKIEAGQQPLELQVCSPQQVLSDVISTMQVRADAKGLRLSAEFEGNRSIAVKTDPIRLRQILVNLIGNAIKFTEVGCVRVVMRLDATPDSKGRLIFDVIDTGCGMSADQMGMLFRPFVQVDGSARRRFGGTGLGLAISKRLAEMLGGDIVVRSSPGQGSTFSLGIGTGDLDGSAMTPVPDNAVNAKESACNAQQKLNCRILLAEDGPDNQRLIALLLRKAGAEVTVAENGQIAVDLALAAQQAGKPFDVILMDIQMPVMDGYEATQKLRGAGYSEPIIALTAHAMKGDRQKCCDAGCDDYISKPIDPRKLVDVLEAWVPSTPNRA